MKLQVQILWPPWQICCGTLQTITIHSKWGLLLFPISWQSLLITMTISSSNRLNQFWKNQSWERSLTSCLIFSFFRSNSTITNRNFFSFSQFMHQSFVLREIEVSIEKICFFPDRPTHILFRVCPLNYRSTLFRIIKRVYKNSSCKTIRKKLLRSILPVIWKPANWFFLQTTKTWFSCCIYLLDLIM